jgi:hypothetical protein
MNENKKLWGYTITNCLTMIFIAGGGIMVLVNGPTWAQQHIFPHLTMSGIITAAACFFIFFPMGAWQSTRIFSAQLLDFGAGVFAILTFLSGASLFISIWGTVAGTIVTVGCLFLGVFGGAGILALGLIAILTNDKQGMWGLLFQILLFALARLNFGIMANITLEAYVERAKADGTRSALE